MFKNLDFYIDKYYTDKKISGYSQAYEFLFNEIRGEVSSVLEVGVGSLDVNVEGHFLQIQNLYYPEYKQGGSLRVWRDYFPKAQVHGLDIAEDCRISEDRINTFICDSRDKKQLDQALQANTYDIIIDDGLHKAEAQLQTLKNLLGRVKFGGFYIIEDLGGGGDGVNLFAGDSLSK